MQNLRVMEEIESFCINNMCEEVCVCIIFRISHSNSLLVIHYW